jgi:uncharacterized lipoprotein
MRSFVLSAAAIILLAACSPSSKSDAKAAGADAGAALNKAADSTAEAADKAGADVKSALATADRKADAADKAAKDTH